MPRKQNLVPLHGSVRRDQRAWLKARARKEAITLGQAIRRALDEALRAERARHESS